MLKIFKFLQKLVFLIDSIITYFIFALSIIMGIMEKQIFFVSYKNATIFAYLFLYNLGKLSIGFIIFIILLIMHKKVFLKYSLYIIIPWIILTALILFYDIMLINNNICGGKELLIFIISISIGTLTWNKVLLYKIELKKSIVLTYAIFSILINYLLLIIFHLISGF